MDFLVGCCAAWSGILTPTVVDAMQCLTMVQSKYPDTNAAEFSKSLTLMGRNAIYAVYEA